MKMQAFAPLSVAGMISVLALTACGGGSIPGGGSVPAGASPALLSAGGNVRTPLDAPQRKGVKSKVTMTIRIPKAPRHLSARGMRPYFVAASTRGVLVVVYAHGNHGTPLATTAVDVAAGSKLCQAASGGLGRTCTVPGNAPTGNDDFVVTTYDAAPVNNGFAGAKQLAEGTTTLDVLKGKDNPINLTLGGVVAKGAVALTTASIPAIDNNSQTITVSALDADNNTIVGGWFDASGNAVTMSVDTSVGPNVASFFKFTPATVTQAAPTSVMAYTSSGPTSAQIQSGFTGVVWANPSNGGTSGATNLAVAKPAITEFPIATSNAYPEGITVGPDNASLWFAESNGEKIGTISMTAAAGTTTTDYGGLSANASPTNLASDGGKIWFTEFGISKIGSIDPTSHTVTEYKTPSCGPTCGTIDNPYDIIKGPDGNLWFTENCTTNSKIGTFGAALPTAMVEYNPPTSNGAPAWITTGPDNNLWFTEPGGGSINRIGTMTTSDTGVVDYPVSPTNTIYSGGIATGSDGALWFAECNPPGNAVGRITTAGTVTGQYGLATSNSSPLGVTQGPDGAIWFAENGNNAIGRIDPTTHAIVEFPLPRANGNPWGITLAPDGALWFTECGPSGGNRIGRLQ